MAYEEEDTCMAYEEEDTCMAYEEEDTYLARCQIQRTRHPDPRSFSAGALGNAGLGQGIALFRAHELLGRVPSIPLCLEQESLC
jgi:hypothetical protein